MASCRNGVTCRYRTLPAIAWRATANRARLGARDQARRLPADGPTRCPLVGIRFERLRATAKAVDLLDRKAATVERGLVGNGYK
jgi:hypothetical protein